NMDLTVITQPNGGGAGGFYRGMQHAFQSGADWIWCMDDDVFPRPDCLVHLLPRIQYDRVGILAPRRLLEGQVYTNDFRAVNLTRPFSSMYEERLSGMQVDAPVEICGTAFEGPLIRREVVEQIGLPNKEFFIFCDDTDYCLRTSAAGYKILYVPDALMDKQNFFSGDSWSERNRKKKWKRFYQIRNAAYLNHHYGRNWAVRYLRSFNAVAGYIFIAFFSAPFTEAYTWGDIARFWGAYRDGVKGRLGKM
ncbi:MAG: glycosyltransferase, partial [Paraprevotella sp.]|nr:glycosyltransferase [Paraprevotella sp.]